MATLGSKFVAVPPAVQTAALSVFLGMSLSAAVNPTPDSLSAAYAAAHNDDARARVGDYAARCGVRVSSTVTSAAPKAVF